MPDPNLTRPSYAMEVKSNGFHNNVFETTVRLSLDIDDLILVVEGRETSGTICKPDSSRCFLYTRSNGIILCREPYDIIMRRWANVRQKTHDFMLGVDEEFEAPVEEGDEWKHGYKDGKKPPTAEPEERE